MKAQTDWLRLLLKCKENIKEEIRPYLKSPSATQLNLGTGAGGDLIKPVDLAAEKAIIEVFQQCDFSFLLISEESGVKKFGEDPPEAYVTIDPIDGTTNLLHGIPFFASSIAISTQPSISSVCAALVIDLFHDITYTAEVGMGSYRDGEKIASCSTESLEKAVIGLDLNSYKSKDLVPQITKLIQRTKHVRHFGANALELCYVADGSTDAFIDVRGKIRTTDVAAAFLILKEAGGIVTLLGKPLNVALDPQEKIKFIASGNKNIHKTILSLVNPQC